MSNSTATQLLSVDEEHLYILRPVRTVPVEVAEYPGSGLPEQTNNKPVGQLQLCPTVQLSGDEHADHQIR